MHFHVLAARLFAALPAFQVVRGIDGPACSAGKVLGHLSIPGLVSGFLDPFMRFPQLDPVRLCRLKGLQIVAGVLRALAAKVHALFSGAFRHGADAQAEIASLFRTASMAFQFLDRTPPCDARSLSAGPGLPWSRYISCRPGRRVRKRRQVFCQ